MYIYIYRDVYASMYAFIVTRFFSSVRTSGQSADVRCQPWNLRHVAVQMIRRAAMQVETTVDGGGLAY